MSSESSILRGITHKDLKVVIAKAFEMGWSFAGMGGNTMAIIEWKNGQQIRFSPTASGKDAHKHVAAQIKAICGISLIAKSKTGKSHGGASVKGTDFSIPQSNIEQRSYHGSPRGITEDSLIERHGYLLGKFKHFAKKGRAASAGDINKCIEITREIKELEHKFHILFPHIPLDDFDAEVMSREIEAELQAEYEEAAILRGLEAGDIVVPQYHENGVPTAQFHNDNLNP